MLAPPRGSSGRCGGMPPGRGAPAQRGRGRRHEPGPTQSARVERLRHATQVAPGPCGRRSGAARYHAEPASSAIRINGPSGSRPATHASAPSDRARTSCTHVPRRRFGRAVVIGARDPVRLASLHDQGTPLEVGRLCGRRRPHRLEVVPLLRRRADDRGELVCHGLCGALELGRVGGRHHDRLAPRQVEPAVSSFA